MRPARPRRIISPPPHLRSIYIHKYYMNLLWWNYTYTTHPPSSDWRVLVLVLVILLIDTHSRTHIVIHTPCFPWPIQEQLHLKVHPSVWVCMFVCVEVCVLRGVVLPVCPALTADCTFSFFSSHPITEWKLISRFRRDLWTLGSGISIPPSTHAHTHIQIQSLGLQCLSCHRGQQSPHCNNLPSRHPNPDKLQAWWGWRPHAVGRDL